MDAGLLDVLHDPGDRDLGAVAERVDVHLDRVLEEAVEEKRVLRVGLDVLLEVRVQALRRVTDLHRPAAQDVRGAHQKRESDVLGDHLCLLGRERGPVVGVADLQAAKERAEAPAVLRQVDRVDGRAQERHTGLFERARKAQRGLAPELDDHALRLLDLDHREHVLDGERLEVEAVGGVVVGRDRLGVAVDHHRVAAGLAHGHRGMDAAVVELDALADPVRPRAEDHDGLVRAPANLAAERLGRALVRGVEVGRARLELGGAGVDRLEGALEPVGPVALARQGLELAQEPHVHMGAAVDLLRARLAAKRLGDQVEAVGAGRLEPLEEFVGVCREGRPARPARASASPSRRTRGRSGRSPSPRRPTSCAW